MGRKPSPWTRGSSGKPKSEGPGSGPYLLLFSLYSLPPLLQAALSTSFVPGSRFRREGQRGSKTDHVGPVLPSNGPLLLEFGIS